MSLLPPGPTWRAAMVLGLITSSFSTVVAQLLAARIGRDAAIDWMTVAAIPSFAPGRSC